MSLRNMIAAVRPFFANTSLGRMASLAFCAAVYGAAMLLPHPHRDIRDAVWAFLLSAALIWGIVERQRAQRPPKPKHIPMDPRSELRLHSS